MIILIFSDDILDRSHHPCRNCKFNLIPFNIAMAGLEVALVNAMNRERVLKQFLEPIKGRYDYVLLDCMPSLGMLMVNSLAAADAALIPVQANYLSAKGLEQLFQTITRSSGRLIPSYESKAFC